MSTNNNKGNKNEGHEQTTQWELKTNKYIQIQNPKAIDRCVTTVKGKNAQETET